MKISIVVPAFNEEKIITRSLGAIHKARAAFSELGWESEVIVCDNNSTDGTAKTARAAGARIVFEPVNQISRARNRGGAAAGGDWLLFVDADSFPNRELFADVAAAIQSGKCLGGGVTVRLDSARGWLRTVTETWNFLSRTMRWMAGSFIFCEAKAFRALGGFSQELFAAEELEFSKRLKRLARQQGKRLIILRRHPLLTSARKAELYGKGEHLRMLLSTIWRRGANLKERSACALWYDGRR